MSYTLIFYTIYLPVSVAITMIVGHSLFKNGRPFLIEIFRQKEILADSVNRLLLMGFYLLNIGYITFTMNTGSEVLGPEHLVERLSIRLGSLMLILGVVHLVNIGVLYKTRRSVQV
ncbi:MAG: hypothetical protein AAGI38_11445 [Bacteroidota bacterium]